ncbi:hypothetical protein PRUPE_2G227800 [Prunus persica]|uniref:Uncharacterized protein n=1 Tax=Prunus persica TaxID=3760 RepID=A0A251QK57_PRUPE|nr:hypothetical protein PRUPE_2G227800 [Prunus persica]
MITLHNCAPTSMMSQRMQFLARAVRFSVLSAVVGFSCCAQCGHTRGRAILMDCRICGKSYDHWPDILVLQKSRE